MIFHLWAFFFFFNISVFLCIHFLHPTHANYQLFSIHQTDEFTNIILSVKPFLTTAHLNIILLFLHSFLDVPPAQWKTLNPSWSI